MRMKNDFHIKGWAPTLALKQRPGGTRKWSISPYVRNPDFEILEIFPESRILGFGIRKTAHGFRNQTNDWNPESKFHWETLEFITVIRNPRRGIQNPAMTVNSLTWGAFGLIACFIENQETMSLLREPSPPRKHHKGQRMEADWKPHFIK